MAIRGTLHKIGSDYQSIGKLNSSVTDTDSGLIKPIHSIFHVLWIRLTFCGQKFGGLIRNEFGSDWQPCNANHTRITTTKH